LGINEQTLKSPKIQQDPDLYQQIDITQKTSEKLLNLVNDLLDINKLENAKLEINLQKFKLIELISNLPTMMQALLKGKKINFNIKLLNINGQQLIISDQDKINRILINLLMNAAKFTQKGKIELHIYTPKKFPQQIHFKVIDTGQGILEKNIPYLFKPFFTTDNNLKQADFKLSSRLNKGSGLGLLICKTFTKLLKGEITVSSIYQQGTEFTFWIENQIQKDITYEPVVEIKQNNITQKIRHKKILICDDDEFNRRLIEMILKDKIRYKTVKDGPSALTQAAKEKYDLILLDIKMPSMNGFEVIKKIKEINLHQNTPIVALTAYSMPEEVTEILKSGFNQCLNKPFKEEDILNLINEILT